MTFVRDTAVHAVEPPTIETEHGTVSAEIALVCPGDDLRTLFADRPAPYRLTRYAELPQAAALRSLLEAEQAEYLANRVHLIVVRGADESLVVGDSHHCAPTPILSHR